jgi:hypothetical protein
MDVGVQDTQPPVTGWRQVAQLLAGVPTKRSWAEFFSIVRRESTTPAIRRKVLRSFEQEPSNRRTPPNQDVKPPVQITRRWQVNALRRQYRDNPTAFYERVLDPWRTAPRLRQEVLREIGKEPSTFKRRHEKAEIVAAQQAWDAARETQRRACAATSSETRTRQWLEKQMGANPKALIPTDAELFALASEQFDVSKTAFYRAKADAIRATGAINWRKAARRSAREIAAPL